MKKNSVKYIFLTFAFFSLFFCSKIYASSFAGTVLLDGNTDMDFSSNSAVYPTTGCITGSSTTGRCVTFFQFYRGIYPDTSVQLGGYGYLWNWTGLTSFSTVSGTNLDGTIANTDGNYWVNISFGQCAGSNPCPSTGDNLFVSFQRIDGNWYTNNSPATTTSLTSSISFFTSPNWHSPSSNATTTLSATFTFPYFILGDELPHYQEACLIYSKFRSDNASSTLNAPSSVCDVISSSGNKTFSHVVTLEDNSLYSYYGIILGTSTQPFNTKTITSILQTGVVTGSGIVPAGWVENLNENATSSSGFLSFLNVPALLETKAPFAYVPQFISQLQQLDNNPSYAFPSSAFQWKFASGTSVSQTYTIDLFSTTTITRFLSPTYVAILRGFMVVVTYFSTIWFLYHDAKKRHIV